VQTWFIKINYKTLIHIVLTKRFTVHAVFSVTRNAYVRIVGSASSIFVFNIKIFE